MLKPAPPPVGNGEPLLNSQHPLLWIAVLCGFMVILIIVVDPAPKTTINNPATQITNKTDNELPSELDFVLDDSTPSGTGPNARTFSDFIETIEDKAQAEIDATNAELARSSRPPLSEQEECVIRAKYEGTNPRSCLQ